MEEGGCDRRKVSVMEGRSVRWKRGDCDGRKADVMEESGCGGGR